MIRELRERPMKSPPLVYRSEEAVSRARPVQAPQDRLPGDGGGEGRAIP
jgi:hypothetical protein